MDSRPSTISIRMENNSGRRGAQGKALFISERSQKTLRGVPGLPLEV